jgi:nitrite reductase/ring-hydroxylating ferredoxin subunit
MACCVRPQDDDGGPPDEDGYYFVCEYNELELNRGLRVRVGKKPVAIFKVKTPKTRVYALADTCTHKGTPINTGDIEDLGEQCVITCPGHGIQFDLRTGVSVQHPDKYRQRTYHVKRKESQVWIKPQ